MLTGGFKGWHLTASNIPGFLANSNPLERNNRGLHGINSKNASHAAMLTVVLPNILKLDSIDRVGIVRTLPFTPACLLKKAQKFVENSKNFYIVPGTMTGRNRNVVNTYVIHVNTTENMDLKRPVTKARVCEFDRATTNKSKVTAYRPFVLHGHGLHRVFIRDDADFDCETNGNECDCHRFWQIRTCPHILAAQHMIGGMNICQDLKAAHPANRKRGRKAHAVAGV